MPPPSATIAAAALPADWQRVDLRELALALPPSWLTTTAEDLDLSAATTELVAQNPDLKSLLDGNRQALVAGQVQLIAYDLDPEHAADGGFPPSLRVGRQSFSAAPTLAAVSDANEQDLRASAGFSEVERDTVMLAGYEATRLAAQFQLKDASGEPLTLALEQYLILQGKDLFVIAWSIPAGKQSAQGDTVERAMATLRLKPPLQ